VPLENVPVALNCCVVPLIAVGLVGITLMELKVAAEGVTLVPPPQAENIAGSKMIITIVFAVFFIIINSGFSPHEIN
jgi:hypothetical protein